MEEYKVVHFHIFKPHDALFKQSRNDRAEVQTVLCCNSENCGLFRRGECSFVAAIGCHKCPYGKYNKYEGFTRKASKYSAWIKEQEERYAGVSCLKSHSTVMALVGEYIFLPYSFMTMNGDVPFLSKETLWTGGNCFLELENFTVENIDKLLEFRPQSLMGGEITSYQTESLPKFLKHLSEQMPELFNRVVEINGRVKGICAKFTNIGRKAILETTIPNAGLFKDIHGGLWKWDGKVLTSTNSKAAFVLVSKFTEMMIVPSEKQVVTITDEGQVGKDTVFVD